MAATPSALQLRLLQTVVDVAAEKNSTLVMPFPVELLRFFERADDTTRLAAVESAISALNGQRKDTTSLNGTQAVPPIPERSPRTRLKCPVPGAEERACHESTR